MTFDEFNQLKSQIDDLRRRADQSQGALGQLKITLKEEFQCQTMKEARERLRKLEKEQEREERELEKELEKFNGKWSNVLYAKVMDA